ncbi:hypothetical protein XU18_0801 [Perkinsela sp. CCAP 1560/4]|nr:hypothetical protein XU18_0801 [Perkinsela sp. CCAP 1560/4]|eukprot:KNH08747.1 hypothetical protein XU18_0801 [Perkinsela sp. CCAP 1560/4]
MTNTQSATSIRAESGKIKADALEKKQYEYRGLCRIKENRFTPFDEILNNYLLLTGAEGYVLALCEQKISVPELRPFQSIIQQGMTDAAYLREMLSGITVMIRVDHQGRVFWMHIAQLLISLMGLNGESHFGTPAAETEYSYIERPLAEKLRQTHPGTKEAFHGCIENLIGDMPHGENYDDRTVLLSFLKMDEHAVLRRYPFFKQIKESIALELSARWVMSFEKQRMSSYEMLTEKYQLQSKGDGPNERCSMEPNDHHLSEESSKDIVWQRAQDLLVRWHVKQTLISDQTLLFTSTLSDKLGAPEYVARVTWGLEWGNYNRTHYDVENPPPAVEKAYYFDVAYPKLPRDSKVKFQKFPTEKGWEDAVCILKIFAEKYDTLIFEIRNGPINTNPHEGYRCEFQNGIFSLYFSLKPLRYTRI